jgi:purine-binding chemotaxis protein CheW
MAAYEDLEQIDILNEDEDTQKNKYLTFNISTEDYAIEIKNVIEIIGIQKITEVPNVKKYIKGIINLRGIINPVIDVRMRFGIENKEYDDRTCIVVVHINGVSVGLIVDEVNEVVNISEDMISAPPKTNKGSQSRYIQGIARIGDNVKILLNINKLLYDEDSVIIDSVE